jgi:transposase
VDSGICPGFQQDNALCHKVRKTTQWLADQGIATLSWPPYSPDLNPIEHLWDELERAIHKRAEYPTNIEQLKTALHEEWNRPPDELRHTLVDLMPNRVAAVHAAKGYPTAY